MKRLKSSKQQLNAVGISEGDVFISLSNLLGLFIRSIIKYELFHALMMVAIVFFPSKICLTLSGYSPLTT